MSIQIKGARANNLRNIDVTIPEGKLVVITGVSGSGKSSLAFDTLFAEGQRRFAQSLSSYARQFLGRMNRPDVDFIEGVPPAIAIEQKVNIKNPRSTVATTTEIYDYLRLVYSRAGTIISPISGREVRADSVQDVANHISGIAGGNVHLLAAVRWEECEDEVAYLITLKERGYSRLFAGGRVVRIDDVLQNVVSCKGSCLLIDRFNRDVELDRTRLLSSVNNAFEEGRGDVLVEHNGTLKHFCSRLEADGMTFREPDEYLFSFNSPLGACPVCGGLGKIMGISEDLVVPDKSKSIYDDAIACWKGEKMGWFRNHLIEVSSNYGIPVFAPYCELTEQQKRLLWEGDPPREEEAYDENPQRLVGINEFFRWVETQRYKIQFKYMLSRFSGKAVCNACHGSRLRKEALYVKVGGKDISEVLDMTCRDALEFFRSLSADGMRLDIIRDPLSEVLSRLECICDVGLGYLTLSRSCNTLSGGESQRINLVTALGSSLVGSMYILDEPSIGLHSKDTARLISVLKRLRDMGNTVVVVEHDEDIMRSADILIDMGPGAGENGGQVVFQGKVPPTPTQEQLQASLTLGYLCSKVERYSRRKRSYDYYITVNGAREHNLKNIDVRFPLNVLTVVSGVSGSGKSTLVGDILYPALNRMLNDTGDLPGTFGGLSGNTDRITRVEYVDQNPIGRNSRSNPVTYLKVYDLIRQLLCQQQYARQCGFTPSTFSFNQDGGRCPECLGEGVVHIEMQFMADVEMVCEECGGKRFKPDVLEVRYRGLNVNDILNLTVDAAIEFFRNGEEQISKDIAARLQPLADVGLGYVRLGQSSATLSGGESQRIKLASFLTLSSSRNRDRIMFIFDEPTTGLHFSDVSNLLKCFDALLDAGHSIVVVEHNPDVIRNADYLIELGPGAGRDGGTVVSAG